MVDLLAGLGAYFDGLDRGAYHLGKVFLYSRADAYTLVHCAIHPPISWYIYLSMCYENFGKLSMIVSIFLVIRVLHQRPVRSILTANNQLNWKLFAKGFGLYFLFFLIAAILTEYLFMDFSLRSDIKLGQVSAWATTVLVASIIISAMAEEVFSRGYILQGLGLLIRNRILLATASGFIFMAGHIPLDEPSNLLFLLACFEMGFYLTIVTLQSNGLELAIGMHSAHNIGATLLNYGARDQPIHFTIFFPICAVIMYLIIFRRNAIGWPETENLKTLKEVSTRRQSKTLSGTIPCGETPN